MTYDAHEMETCPQCGGPMLSLGWLNIEIRETACPKCCK